MVEAKQASGVHGEISIRNVSKTFIDAKNTEVKALQNINLEIKAGELITIIGPSGCGKSTLLRLVSGLENPNGGELYIDGERITGPHFTRGFAFQNPTLFPWKDVWHNVATGLEARGILKEHAADVDEYIELVGLTPFKNAFPHQLSGGMAQRVALARALVNHPKALLLDEPLGALDALTRMSMQDEILRIWNERKMTLLFVTHDIDEAIYLGDRVVIMSANPGQFQRIIAIDIPKPRRRNDDIFFRYKKIMLDALGVSID
ncbi:ABC transporter ATP-binding protein [Sporomusa acidovorans]|uniref:Aliphatic sulfonates import ATP-binding protein SsuB n=1 Tax=Sporomusa acidovorans (strain ATCC 49682 / DSM 3132 / Mol) TaxID=1123286 RepID=A0ABZ3IWU7_SPOA4|nr:ABC transporter ATP-binding protein [Sporomusa acidovorans]OZC23373.1 aliphatic sulfonates import ATP-binding protein SsuB [Sporomusa acidovorans DSM 3132]SDE43428.1 sulfonate transport system ATP-binding protein [Sporomusa acidovorans]